jgi:hypothetical protein
VPDIEKLLDMFARKDGLKYICEQIGGMSPVMTPAVSSGNRR